MMNGYGMFGVMKPKKHPVLAHRFAYELTHGEIPEGLKLRHTCEGRYERGDRTCRRCCNPAHLAPGTDAQNRQDSVDADRHKRALTSEQIADAKLLRRNGMSAADVAKRFGVCEQTIHRRCHPGGRVYCYSAK